MEFEEAKCYQAIDLFEESLILKDRHGLGYFEVTILSEMIIPVWLKKVKEPALLNQKLYYLDKQ